MTRKLLTRMENLSYLIKTVRMHNIIRNISLLSVFLSFCISCSRDLGNYDYRELSDPGMPQLADLSVLTYSRLHIDPEFSNDVDESLYDFEWEAVDRSGSLETYLISEEKVLDYEVTLVPGLYSLYFRATEKSSGIFWQTEVQLSVNSSTSEGWMVLCSDQGMSRLDFISKITGETVIDVLASSGMTPLQGPRKIQWLSSKTDAASPYYLITDSGTTRLGRDAFEWKPEYDFSYEVAVRDKLVPHSIVSAGFGKVVVSDGKAHYCEIMGIDGLYGSAVNKDFRVAPYVGTNVSASEIYAAVYLLYDIDSKRMIAYCPLLANGDLGGYQPLMGMDEFTQIADGTKPGQGVLGNAFDAWPQGYDCLYMENTKYDPGNAKMGMTYVLLVDSESCHLYGVQIGDILCYSDCTYVIGKGYYGDLTSCPDITSEGTLYAFSSLKNYMYYASGSNVYRVDLSKTPLSAELHLSLPGERITCLKFNLCQKAENMQKSYDLLVGSLASDGGRLRIYEGRESDGNFSEVEPEMYGGFAEIVDVTYKEKVY